jgi:hypothetical protein
VANADGVDPQTPAHLQAKAADRLDAAIDLAIAALEAYYDSIETLERPERRRPTPSRRPPTQKAPVVAGAVPVHDARDPLRYLDLTA